MLSLRTTVAALVCLCIAHDTAQSQPRPKHGGPALPRISDGHPDLQGTWNIATLTPMERLAEFAGKLTVSDEEARAFEKKGYQLFEERPDLPPAALTRAQEANAIGAGDSEIWEAGTELARINGLKRTSLIVDPPDGKVPALTHEGQERASVRSKNRGRADSVKDLPLSDRCLGFTSVPTVPTSYNNNYQIVQTPEYVMILGEMIHDVRIIRMNATHIPASIRQWLGDSIGHWEGDTLVIDTANFKSPGAFDGSTQYLHVIERLSRSSADTLLYRATIDDPATFTTPWTIEFPFVATTDRIFEYACHEGNSWVESRLKAARKATVAAGAK